MTRMTMSAALAAAIFTAAGAANAFTIDSSTYGVCLSPQTTSCSIGQATLTAKPLDAVFVEQDFEGLKGLGVEDDGIVKSNPDKEIQGQKDEMIVMDFTAFSGGGLILDEIVLGQYYNPDEFRNDPTEIAIIDVTFVNGMGTETLKLTNFGNEADGDGSTAGFTVESNSEARNSINDVVDLIVADIQRISTETGEFVLSNLFGGKRVATLTFSAGNNPTQNDGSDYSVVSVSAIPVPAPFALLLAGLGGLGFLSWRRRAAA